MFCIHDWKHFALKPAEAEAVKVEIQVLCAMPAAQPIWVKQHDSL